MQQQNWIQNEKGGVVNINPSKKTLTEEPPEQSKDEILKARFTSDDADKIKAFCSGRRISVSDYLRRLNDIDPQYYDHIDLLNRNADLLVPLLNRIVKNF